MKTSSHFISILVRVNRNSTSQKINYLFSSKYSIKFSWCFRRILIIKVSNRNIVDKRLVEGIIQFIKMNSFSEVPELNKTRYLSVSGIKTIRVADSHEICKHKSPITLIHHHGKYLKVLFNFREAVASTMK